MKQQTYIKSKNNIEGYEYLSILVESERFGVKPSLVSDRN